MNTYNKGNFYYWEGRDETNSIYRVRWSREEKLFCPEVVERKWFRKPIFKQIEDGFTTEEEAWLFISKYDSRG